MIHLPRPIATFLLEDAFIREWKELGAEFRYVEYEGVERGERGDEGKPVTWPLNTSANT